MHFQRPQRNAAPRSPRGAAFATLGHTGGSTGKPLAFWYDDAKHELMRAGMCRGYMMSGWRPGQKILNFWGARQDVVAGGVFGQQLGSGLGGFHRRRADHPRLGIQRGQPACLGPRHPGLPPDPVAGLRLGNDGSRPPRAGGAHAHADSLIGVYSTAEVLDDTQQRELMQRAFGCKVFNQYGSREVPNMACECRHGNMHVFTDHGVPGIPPHGRRGPLLVTSLTNRLMPFIRYDIGDSGRLLDGECGCGSPFPLMAMGMCRRNDLIRTRDGKRIHPVLLQPPALRPHAGPPVPVGAAHAGSHRTECGCRAAPQHFCSGCADGNPLPQAGTARDVTGESCRGDSTHGFRQAPLRHRAG
jgi:phenylacetate-CoA ligase